MSEKQSAGAESPGDWAHLCGGGGDSQAPAAFRAVRPDLPHPLYSRWAGRLGAAAENAAQGFTWLAFRQLAAAVNIVLYRISNPICLGGTVVITALTAVEILFQPLAGTPRFPFALGVIWFTVVTAILPLNVGQWVVVDGLTGSGRSTAWVPLTATRVPGAEGATSQRRATHRV